MAEIGSWHGHKFVVSPTLIRGFTGLSVTGESNIENKETGGQEYATRKSGKPIEINLTVELNRSTGCDVRGEALAFVSRARDGAKDYFYVGGSKLTACQLMLVKASVTETTFSPNATMTSAKVALTMRQCSKNDGSAASGGGSSGGGSSGGGSGKKTSVKKSTKTTTTKKSTGIISTIVSGIKNVASKVVSSVKNSSLFKTAQSVIKKITTNAKKASAPKKTVPKPAAIKKKKLLK